MPLSQCILYATGFYLTLAFDDLSFKAVAFQSPIYPGPTSLYEANNALDRNTATCMRTDQIGNNSLHKNTWWKVDLGGMYNIYSISILFKNYETFEYRQRGRFAGFSLYVANTVDIEGSTLCYKDGPQLPPLNFTTTCINYGRYIIFYNERLGGGFYPEGYQLSTLFTELCEVIVKGCKQPGVYGSKCDTPCPIACKSNTCHIQSGGCLDCEHGIYGKYCNLSCPLTCKDNTCHMQNGTCMECIPGVYGSYCNQSCPNKCKDRRCLFQSGICLTCESGWAGTYCNTECTKGWYGLNCSYRCSGHCRDGVTCNHVTGQCDGGCNVGWTGVMCEKYCDDGTFGYNCVNNCSGHCLNNYPCNKQSGHCDRGCNPGYTQNDCNTKCTSGYFGVDCRERCSGHCKSNKPCDHVSGECPGGCQDGYMDEYCNSSCKADHYGINCTFRCSAKCNGTCHHLDGSCKDCEEGWIRHCYKEHMMLNRNMSISNRNWIIGLSVSLVINLVFIIGVCLLCRGIYTKKVSISRELLSCSKKSIYYTNTDVTTGDNSTYQELDLSREDITYQNTTIL